MQSHRPFEFHNFLYDSFQITIWDYVRYGANDFLGEVFLDLAAHPLDDEAEWYTLSAHQERNIRSVSKF